MPAPELNAVITKKIEVAPGLCILHISPDGWELPDFKPGQFVALGLPGSSERYQFSYAEVDAPDPNKIIRRAYSIASGSKDKEYFEIYVSLVKSGALSPRLFNLKIGDKLWVNKKVTGMFTLDEVPDSFNIMLFATGTGVAPYMSMLRTNSIMHEKRKYAVVHGAYNSWDLGYRSELVMIENFCDNFNYIPTITDISNEPMPWNSNIGFVQSVWERKLIQEKWGMEITPENTHIFLCGHPKMIDDMTELLEKDGFIEHKRKKPGQIHVEKF